MKINKYGAIDIGSNAVRLLISHVVETKKKPLFKKNSLVRVPIRLGEDSFFNGKIGENNQQRLREAMKSFKLLMNVHGVLDHHACATSAMRDASNGMALVEKIKEESDISIQIIDGKKEAQILFSTQIAQLLDPTKTYLYVDVGGGSTEITIFSKMKQLESKSFNIGTLRLLYEKIGNRAWVNMRTWVKAQCENFDEVSIIGTGGNINTLFKMSGASYGIPLTYAYLNSQYNFISSYSFDERIEILDMNPDRADVILHATNIFIKTMDWSGSNYIHIPKIGLVDGIIRKVYERNC